MSAFLSQAKEQALMFWAMGTWAVFFTLTSLITAVITALTGCTWATLDAQGKFMIVCLVFLSWGQTMMALLIQVQKRLANGQLPIQEGDSTLISQQVSQQTRRVTKEVISETATAPAATVIKSEESNQSVTKTTP